jgi:predicted DCC family thiol-disulfide oxidoreductase YuxK
VTNRLLNAWNHAWFKNETTVPLEIVRIGAGLALLVSYLSFTPQLDYFFGNGGVLTLDALSRFRENPWHQSAFYYFTQPWQFYVFHAVFLFCTTAFTVGWRTNWVKWVVLAGHVSFLHRNPAIYYGVDNILASLVFILCIVPVGRALSLDRVRTVRRAKQVNLTATPELPVSPFSFAARRLVQIQMAVFFLFAGIEKLRGETWWNGDALWIAITNHEFSNVRPEFFAEQYWIVNLLTYFTLAIELSYPFLIWGRRTRSYFLIGGVALHVGIALLMGLYLFSFAMIVGHMAFLRHEWLRALGRWWKEKIGALEMIYDGDCGFCKRSMAWLLAFDGLKQISIRNTRTDPSPVVATELVDRALYLVTAENRALPGFDAYRHVVARVPGLWWQIPFFYLPFVSRAIGRAIYNWIATHRHVSFTCAADKTCAVEKNT